MIRSLIKRRVTPLKPLLARIANFEATVSRAWAAGAHRRLFKVQWGLPPEPEYFDHHIDLHLWGTEGNSLWLERGVYSSLALRPGARVLELCCGDGFNAKHFYAHRATSVIAVDVDPKAIAWARIRHARPNITFAVGDIRRAMPSGVFDNVIWDGAIEHFTLDEIGAVLADIRQRLSPDGILSGYTIAAKPDGKSLSHHQYEFKDKEDLLRVLAAAFKNVVVFETVYPSRHNLYFWAGDDVLPFAADWPRSVHAFRGDQPTGSTPREASLRA